MIGWARPQAHAAGKGGERDHERLASVHNVQRLRNLFKSKRLNHCEETLSYKYEIFMYNEIVE